MSSCSSLFAHSLSFSFPISSAVQQLVSLSLCVRVHPSKTKANHITVITHPKRAPIQTRRAGPFPLQGRLNMTGTLSLTNYNPHLPLLNIAHPMLHLLRLIRQIAHATPSSSSNNIIVLTLPPLPPYQHPRNSAMTTVWVAVNAFAMTEGTLSLPRKYSLMVLSLECLLTVLFMSNSIIASPGNSLIVSGVFSLFLVFLFGILQLSSFSLLILSFQKVFFAHCHPARAIIHKPTFASALSHNHVPKHLLHAVCALAAPLSKQPRIKTTPSRYAGKPFAQEALSLMFDGAGRLVCEPDLATAQALALLLMHDVLTKEKNTMWNTRYAGEFMVFLVPFHVIHIFHTINSADLALQIIENLGVHEPDHPTLTPMPSPDFIHQSFKREAVRRIFWMIHLLDVMASIVFKKPTTFTSSDLRSRLPVDETSYELGVHSTLPGVCVCVCVVCVTWLSFLWFSSCGGSLPSFVPIFLSFDLPSSVSRRV